MNTFYIKRGEKISGPFDLNHVRKLHAAERLRPSDLIAQKNNGPWHKLADVESKLVATSTRTPQTPPEPPQAAVEPLSEATDIPIQEQPEATFAAPLPVAESSGEPLPTADQTSGLGKKKIALLAGIPAALVLFLAVALIAFSGGLDQQLESRIKAGLLDPQSYQHINTRHINVNEKIIRLLDKTLAATTTDRFQTGLTNKLFTSPGDSADATLIRVRYRAASRGGDKILQDQYFLTDSENNIVFTSNFSAAQAADLAEKNVRAERERSDTNSDSGFASRFRNDLGEIIVKQARKNASTAIEQTKGELDLLFDST